MRSRRSSQISGRHALSGEGFPIIPPFPANSLTTTTFQWMHSETWNDEEIDFLLANRQLLVSAAHKPLPHYGRPARTESALAGRWILKKGGLLSSVEVQGFHKYFHRFHILLGPHPEHWRHAEDELALFIGGIILMGDADRLTIVPPDAETSAALSAYEWSRSQKVWVPWPELEHTSAGLALALIQIEPEEFWETASGARSRETLRYLERRMARRRESSAETKKPRPKRGFFSRFFRSGA